MKTIQWGITLTVMLSAQVSALTTSPSASDNGPCDILGSAGQPCVAAHSTVRALYAKYEGPLYTVLHRKSGRASNVSALTAGGFANVTEHEAICPRIGDCVISQVIDQSGNGNHLHERDDRKVRQVNGKFGKKHMLVDASKHKLYVRGNIPVYGMYFDPDYGYHVTDTRGVAKGNEPETIYATMTGKRFGNRCCFDYGNAEADDKSDGAGTMEAIYFGNARWDVAKAAGLPSEGANEGYKEAGCIEASSCPFIHGNESTCDGTSGQGNCCGPWVGADLEFGMYYGGGKASKSNVQNKPLRHDFVSLMLKGHTTGFVLKGGDATKGNFTTMYDGPRPPPVPPSSRWPNGGTYRPMNKKGAIILGTGGDQSNGSRGNFYEGYMTSGATSDITDERVQANIASVGYRMEAAFDSPK